MWIGAIGFIFYGEELSLLTFTQGGEFTLYAAAVIAPTIYLIDRDRAISRLPGHTSYMLIAMVGIALAVAGYAMMAPVAVGLIPITGLKVRLIATASLILYILSLLFALVVNALDNARLQPGVRAITLQQLDRLGTEFDHLEETNGE